MASDKLAATGEKNGLLRRPIKVWKLTLPLWLVAIGGCCLLSVPLAAIGSLLDGGAAPPTSVPSPARAETPAVTATPAPRAPAASPEPSETGSPAAAPTAAPVGAPAQVVDVTDGDTIVVEVDGDTYPVRYIGVDAPEGAGELLGQEATDVNRDLVGGETVLLVVDTSETDSFGRLLRYVYLADGTLVNAELVRRGYARAITYEPDTALQEVLEAAEQEARVEGRGLWAATPAPTEAPQASECTPDAAFQADVTIPDDTRIEIGQPFVKTWRVANTGTCQWGAEYRLSFAGGDQMGGPSTVVVAETPAGGSAEITVELIAPDAPGAYRGEWRMASDDAGLFGGPLYVQIVAFDPAAPAAAPTEPFGVGQPRVVVSPPCCQFDAPGNDNNAKDQEWVCFANEGDAPVDMTGWSLRDEQDWAFEFPPFMLDPGATVRVATGCGVSNAQMLYWCKGGSAAVWNNEGDTVYLFDATGTEVARYSY